MISVDYFSFTLEFDVFMHCANFVLSPPISKSLGYQYVA